MQDFAEKANRSGSAQMHLLLISHKEISNYIDTLPKEKVDGWRGVSDRFLHVRMTDDFSQTCDLISEVIRHDPTLWKSFLARHAAEFKALREKSLASDIFRNEPKAVAQIVEGCFPLHPVSTFILPRLSERVAQNERTLFTFLSAEGIATLPTFLSKYRDDFTLITPDKIFDYFAPIFGRELYGDEIHKIFLTANKILRKADISTLAAKIVKTIALIYMLEQFELLAPTKEQLAEIFSAEYSVNEIARTFDELIEKKFVVYLKQSNNFLKLKETSGVDVRQKIRDMTETFSDDVSICDELNAANFNNFMYPAGYNTEREMTRWFAFRFVDAEIFDATDFDGDGIIFGVLVDGDDALEEISRRLLTESRGKLQCIFVLPKKFVDVRDTVKKFAAVRKLKALAEDDAPLLEEYELIFDDLQDVIKNFIDAYTRPELFRATYIYDGEILPLYRKAALIEQLSKICNKVFPDTPIVNNEVINKNEISSVAANSRNKIVAALLRRELEPNLGLRGNGQEVSIMRSTLIRTGILVDGEDPQINLQPDDFRMSNLLATIKNFVTAGGNFSDLYNRLTAPEGKIG
ncbi:MAG: restriction endonuclease subunit S, partial [Selenomonadaceae bacterium]|nr:restriction endonuclease subunit S [Selenomonadaceae bacterium]